MLKKGGGISGNGTLATIQNNNISNNTFYSRYPDYGFGGGICGCNGIIQNNTISANIGDIEGGGIYGCTGTIDNNTIYSNSATRYGGGLSNCYTTIQNNTIYGNSAYREGGGLLGCNETIQNNLVYGNLSAMGGGLAQCDATIQNNTIYGNSASSGGGLYQCNAIIENNTVYGNSAQWWGGGFYDCPGTIKNCIIWENTANKGAQIYECAIPSYSCIQDWKGSGTGNFSYDPQLVNPANDDFHLQDGSPCIDAGDPGADYYDACRPPRKGIKHSDMGAYGGPYNCWPELTSSELAQYLLGKISLRPEQLTFADANSDGKIDIADVITLIKLGK